MAKIRIVTHGSKFHSDDIFAVATLCLLLEKENEIEIVRTRDPEIIKSADYAVDVGFEYNSERNRFDHHQEGKAGTRDNGIPYSSFGLVWKKYGETLCGDKKIANDIDILLAQPIDAYDNGIMVSEPTIKDVHTYDIRSIVNAYRPTWKEDINIDDIFSELVLFAKKIIEREVKTHKDNKDAEIFVRTAYENSADKRLIILDERYPWEEVLGQYPEPLLVIYPKRVDNTWSLKTIRGSLFTYKARKDLPAEWAGKSGDELEKITGVKDVIFCHNNRFLAVTKTKEAVLKLAEIALNS